MPTILVTGTPGTGKSTICQRVAAEFPQMKFLEVGEIAKKERCFDGWDEERKCHILDEDKLLDIMEEMPSVKAHRAIIDYHGSDLFPERWIDAVFVLRTDTSTLHARLEARNYSAEKIRENVEAEIFQVLLDEAIDSYPSVPVIELQNNTKDDLEANVSQMVEWINKHS